MSPKIFAIANLSLSFVFNDFHTILVFTVNWDYSKQLLICRDFASNLGPLLVDKNPVFFFASSIPQKPTEFFSKLWLLRVQKPIVQCDITKFVAGHNTRNPLEMTSTRHWYCRNCCPTLTSYSATYTCFCYSQILQPSNQPHQTIKSFNHQANTIFNYPGRPEWTVFAVGPTSTSRPMVMKFWTGFLVIICMFWTMALLGKRVASPAMIVLLSRRKIKLINKTIG